MESSTRYCAVVEGSATQPPLRQRFAFTGQVLLEKYISNADIHFLIDDSLLGILTMRYFEHVGVRKVTIYHTGDKPRFNLSVPFKTRNDFASSAEVKAALLADSTITVLV